MKSRLITRLALLALAGFLLGGATCSPTAPTVTTVRVSTTFDLGSTPNVLARSYVLYFGSATQSFTLRFSTIGLSATNSMRVSDLTGGSPQVFTTDGVFNTASITGNGAIVTFTSTGVVTPPTVLLSSATLTAASAAFPTVTTALVPVASSLPIAPGATI